MNIAKPGRGTRLKFVLQSVVMIAAGLWNINGTWTPNIFIKHCTFYWFFRIFSWNYRMLNVHIVRYTWKLTHIHTPPHYTLYTGKGFNGKWWLCLSERVPQMCGIQWINYSIIHILYCIDLMPSRKYMENIFWFLTNSIFLFLFFLNLSSLPF